MSKSTLRSKVEEFFNPGPTMTLDQDGADSNDEHQMKAFFKPKREAVQDMPKRKLLDDIEIDPKYNAKTVSRKDLAAKSDESDSYGSDGESFEEEGEAEVDEMQSNESSEISVGPNISKMDEQQRRNYEVLQQMRKEEMGNGSESEIDAVLDKLEAEKH
jgi:hypothetical protein